MRHMLCVGFSIHVFGSRHCDGRNPSNRYVAYTKHVRFGGLALLDVFFASSKFTHQAYSLAGHGV